MIIESNWYKNGKNVKGTCETNERINQKDHKSHKIMSREATTALKTSFLWSLLSVFSQTDQSTIIQSKVFFFLIYKIYDYIYVYMYICLCICWLPMSTIFSNQQKIIDIVFKSLSFDNQLGLFMVNNVFGFVCIEQCL